MVVLVARTGRELQRYTATGGREVVGIIPFRMKGGMKQEGDDDRPCSNNCLDEEMEVLLISSQKGGDAIMFPKGGWEKDETKETAACREAQEEAGVEGTLEDILGNWSFKSKRYDTMYEGHVFPLKVTKELDHWAEDKVRQRRWVTVAEAREICQQWWMKEALERLVTRLSNTKRQIAYVEEGTGKLVEQKNWSCMKEAQKILVTRLFNTQRQIASMKEGTEKMVEQRNWWMKTALEIIVDHLSNTIRQIVSVKELRKALERLVDHLSNTIRQIAAVKEGTERWWKSDFNSFAKHLVAMSFPRLRMRPTCFHMERSDRIELYI